MLKQTGLCLWVGALAAAACGGPSENDFLGPAAGSHARSGSSGSKATGGASGASAAGKGGSSKGGSGGSSKGGSGGTGMGGGTGGSAMGGTGNGGSAGAALGGSSGTSNETGGTGSGMGGTGMGGGSETGGTGGIGGAGMGGSTESGGASSGRGGRAGTGGMSGRGGKAGKGGNGGSAGAEPSCDELAQAYATALTEAKSCNANSGKDQCTELVAGSLSCGCDQYVNPDNEAAVAELARLSKQAGSRCATVCPAIACLPPGQGTCEPDGLDNGTGQCANDTGILQ